MWKPDRSAPMPLYRQIVEHIERGITYAQLPPGSVLPSERKLAEQLGVNRSTVVQAYEELRASGLVESTVGSGTRVSLTKWGVSPLHTPNWRLYTEGGTFLPNLPFMRRIREVTRYDASIINMASGELSSDLFPNRIVSRILREESFDEHLGYDDPQGYLPLRQALVNKLLQDQNLITSETSMLITSGSQQSLYLITQCLLSPGDAVAIEDPSYTYSLPMFQSAGLRIFRLPVHADGIDPEDIITLYKNHRIRMVFLNPNYQNPTGTTLSDVKKKRVLAIAADLRIPIVEDDPFSLTDFRGSIPTSLKSLDKDGIVLYIGSLSKTAASGLRIGWLVAPQSVVDRLSDARQQMDFGLSIIAQWTAERLLASEEFDKHIKELRQSLQQKQLLMLEALTHTLQDRISFVPPVGGLNVWCKINHAIDDGKLLEEAIKRGVVFVPGSVYGSEPGHVRLSYAKPRPEEIAIGISAFAEALERS
ncbi:DNA-binding transcriptional MocR family regulator [Paenibacillus endophyticus]|uniref:DNA-binding transcriptional MocR family regulator n=1 Tax=Paenibacillus endophyticus TaxID=1294268 RepID=A0A7W5C8L4_9BACL|nr:PLP-dependent aminotransferase family protein [Paenibacillus endophyticus]MBB3153125.1 DNA-binding transcriptional MocR family regulator [Paenibacillus endophyticus]